MKISHFVLILVIILMILYFVEQLRTSRTVINLAYIDQRRYVNSQSGHSVPEEKSSVNENLNFRKSVDILIKYNRIEDAIGQVTKYIETNAQHHYDEALHLSCRWEGILKNERLGVLANSEIIEEKNKLSLCLIELVGKCVQSKS